MKTVHPKAKQRILPYFFILLFLLRFIPSKAQINSPIVLGYFPSWSESWASTGQNSKLRSIPSHINYVFLAFAKPEINYVKGSYDLTGTGLEVPYDGCNLKESVASLKARGVHVILSIGGETYWGSPSDYDNINYQAIKDLVDDMGFVGIDWDFEPSGSFTNIGNATNVQLFKDFIHQSRLLMPRSAGYLIACAPSGVGALGGQFNDDPTSPFRYAQRNALTGETDANLWSGTVPTNGINLFGFSATGHMIPVMNAVGNDIDLIAFQSYNCGASTNRTIMYDAYAYYAEKYGFKLAAGTHYPPEPWGPYYTYNHQNIASLCKHIRDYPSRVGDNDGVMIWELLLSGNGSSAYSYMNVASRVLNGATETNAVSNATVFPTYTYTGGAQGCGSGGSGITYCGFPAYNPATTYPNAGTKVAHNCKIWKSQWYANPGEAPGSNAVWLQQGTCSDGPGCGASTCHTTSFRSIQACQSYTAPSGKILTSTGVYSDTIPNKAQCDSVITIDLTVTALTPSVQFAGGSLSSNITGASYQWLNCGAGSAPISGAIAQTFSPAVSGSYAVRVTKNGCSATSGCYFYTRPQGPCGTVTTTIHPQACNSYLSPAGNTYTLSGRYTETLRSQAGCDSIIEIYLNLTSVTAQVQSINGALAATQAGMNYQWFDCTTGYISGATSQSFQPLTSGSYAVMVTKNGCSAVSSCYVYNTGGATCNTVIRNVTAQSCHSYLSPAGHTYTLSGHYTDTLKTALGCDSIVHINLTVVSIKTGIQEYNATLTAVFSGATYQWLDCNKGMSPIVGATSQTYVPLTNGNYAVRISKNGCTEISSCKSFYQPGLGISEKTLADQILLMPNPAKNYINIRCGDPSKLQLKRVVFYSAVGERILDQVLEEKGTDQRIDFHLTSGLYIAEVYVNDLKVVRRLVIE